MPYYLHRKVNLKMFELLRAQGQMTRIYITIHGPLLNHVHSTGSNADFYITGETQGFSIFNGGKNNGEALPVELVSLMDFVMVLILRLIGKQPQNTTALTLTWNIREMAFTGLYWEQ